ncbi:MAG TPA: hypothetical protein PLD47_06255 [Aggregatilineales bacterium]|nr:hypothetical protein [Aggregatilineales bacterium]
MGGAAACFQGQYQRGANYFEEAEQAFAASGDSIGEAFRRQAYAREYASDLRQFSKTTEYLTVAVQVLRGRVPQTVIIENLLTQAACMVHQNELRRTREIIQQAEALMNEQKAHWFRPELAVIKADIAVLEGNTEDALKHCYTGLGGIGDSGDLRMLSPLYLLLGIILEREKNRESDVQDALDRAIATGRVRARRLHLALALRQMGMHMRRLTARNTVRAKGSGFLFEAERMLGEIQLSEQFPTAPAAPLPQIL